MRVKSVTIAVVVLAVGAVPAVASRQTALRTVPTTVAQPIAVAPAPAPLVVVQPSAVWIPAPSTGIKWTALKRSKPAKHAKPVRRRR